MFGVLRSYSCVCSRVSLLRGPFVVLGILAVLAVCKSSPLPLYPQYLFNPEKPFDDNYYTISENIQYDSSSYVH